MRSSAWGAGIFPGVLRDDRFLARSTPAISTPARTRSQKTTGSPATVLSVHGTAGRGGPASRLGADLLPLDLLPLDLLPLDEVPLVGEPLRPAFALAGAAPPFREEPTSIWGSPLDSTPPVGGGASDNPERRICEPSAPRAAIESSTPATVAVGCTVSRPPGRTALPESPSRSSGRDPLSPPGRGPGSGAARRATASADRLGAGRR